MSQKQIRFVGKSSTKGRSGRDLESNTDGLIDALEAPEELDIVLESVNIVVMERPHDEGFGTLVGVNVG